MLTPCCRLVCRTDGSLLPAGYVPCRISSASRSASSWYRVALVLSSSAVIGLPFCRVLLQFALCSSEKSHPALLLPRSHLLRHFLEQEARPKEAARCRD